MILIYDYCQGNDRESVGEYRERFPHIGVQIWPGISL